jgi:hypothetical protein
MQANAMSKGEEGNEGNSHEKPRDLQNTTWPDVDDPEHQSRGRTENSIEKNLDKSSSSDTDQVSNGGKSTQLPSEETSDKGPL